MIVFWSSLNPICLLSQYNVSALPGSSLEHGLANITHYGLYAFMTIMPASGVSSRALPQRVCVCHLKLLSDPRFAHTYTRKIAMGYYGGKGLPFFFTTLPGVVKTDDNKKSTGAIAKQVRNFGDRRETTIKNQSSISHLAGSTKSFQIHKQLGTYGKYLVPLHVGKVLFLYLWSSASVLRV